METIAALIDGEICGFLSWNKHNTFTAEIHLVGVLEKFHRQGIGRMLVAEVERTLASEGLEFLTVKTLGESRPSEEYDRTRKFYLSMGFRPIQELQGFWGDVPCLLMLKNLRHERV
jgi:ribosomal protein S18 acetylase RimI-like enzyme